MNFTDWLKSLKELYVQFLFLSYFVLAVFFYPYLLTIGIAPKVNFAVVVSVLFLLMPIAVAFSLIFPMFIFTCNELLRDFFWKKINVFYNTNSIDRKILIKRINELTKDDFELLSKLKLNVNDKVFGGNLDKIFFLPINLIVQFFLGLALVLLMIVLDIKTSIGDFFWMFSLLILQVCVYFCWVNKDKNKITYKEFFDLSIMPVLLVLFLVSIGLLSITEKILEKILSGYEFSLAAKYVISWFFCYVVFRYFISPSISIKLNLVNRIKVCLILGIFLVVSASVVGLNFKEGSKEKESPFIYTFSKPAMKALQVLNRGAIERPVIINREMCLKYKELILNDNQSCEERNCFIGNVLLDLDNRYIKTEKGYILELDSTNSTIINNEFYKEKLNGTQRSFCIGFDVGLNI